MDLLSRLLGLYMLLEILKGVAQMLFRLFCIRMKEYKPVHIYVKSKK